MISTPVAAAVDGVKEEANFLLRYLVKVSRQLRLPVSDPQHQGQGRFGSPIQQLLGLWGVRTVGHVHAGLMFISPGRSIAF